jgi:hypothetical protein
MAATGTAAEDNWRKTIGARQLAYAADRANGDFEGAEKAARGLRGKQSQRVGRKQ